MYKSKQREQHCNWKLTKIPALLECLSVYNCSIFCQILFLSLHFLSLLSADICRNLLTCAICCAVLLFAAIRYLLLSVIFCICCYLLLSAGICWYLLLSLLVSALLYFPFFIFNVQAFSFHLSIFFLFENQGTDQQCLICTLAFP